MNSVLIIDDDKELCALMKKCVEQENLSAVVAYGGLEGLRLLEENKDACSLIILDVMMPDMDGFQVLQKIREENNVPVLMLTAKSDEEDKVSGLRLGADDYLTKPFLMQELLLRVQHILQRAYRAELSAAKPTVLQLGPRSVDLNDAVVSLPDGKTLALTATELALLRKLAENRGHIVTYDAICDAVWGADYYGYENSLGVHIRHLREKLETEPGAPRFLRTVRGIGYKLTKEGEP